MDQRVLDLRSVFGITARVTVSSTDAPDGAVEMEVVAEPGARTLIHYHPDQEETYQVLEGTLEVLRSGQWEAVPASGSLSVPPGAIHGFRNPGEDPVRFLNTHRPGAAIEAHLKTVDRLARAGKIRGTKDMRSLIYLSMSSVRHRPDVVIKPPGWVVQAMALLGRLLGYRLDA